MNIKNKVLLYLVVAVVLCYGCDMKQGESTNSIIKCIGITGRTEEETEQITGLLLKDNEGFQDYLADAYEYPHIQRWVAIWGYDFTGDGEDEIIISKGDVNISAVLSYNYVYDRQGKKIFEFVGGDLSVTKIRRDYEKDGTILLYDAVHYASHNDANIYTEINTEEGTMEARVRLLEFDCRPGGYEGEEGYYIFKEFTKEEEIKLWYGAKGIAELIQMKEFVRDDKMLEEYKSLFDKTESFTLIGTMLYTSESANFIWIGADG